MINLSTANKIVGELSSILETDINFISADGYIISSTNEKRIGNYHYIGHDAAIKNEITSHYDDSIQNVCPGVNIPIEFEYKVVCVIGLTGNPDTFQTIAKICKSMTETLIKEIYYSNRINYKTNEMKRTIEYILFDNVSEASIKLQQYFNDDLKNLYFLIVTGHNNKLQQLFNKLASERKYCTSLIGDLLVILTSEQDCYEKELKSYDKLIKVGIGNVKNNFNELINSYYEALSCIRVCDKYDISLCLYNDLKTEHLLNAIPLQDKSNLVNRFFKNIPEDELQTLVSLYIYYYESNRSLIDTAQKFFIHKNTVKYRLEKLKKYADLDYLNIVESALIYYLCRLYYDINNRVL